MSKKPKKAKKPVTAKKSRKPKMPKRLLNTPTKTSGTVRIADFAELLALQAADKSISSQDIISALKRTGDGEDDDEFEDTVSEAFEELAQRRLHSDPMTDMDPFVVDGELLKLKKPKANTDKDFLYVFLLLATRLNMLSEKRHADLDGTALFEMLCLQVAKRYWGASAKDTRISNRVHGVVFGTARAGWRTDNSVAFQPQGFHKAVDDLCNKIGEGIKFRTKDPDEEVTAVDDKLDVVVWRNFSDLRSAKLVGFGQCKTGDHWEGELPRLNPMTFVNRWFHETPCVLPVKLFFLAERVVDRWKTRAYEAGILFDRCRILEYADEVTADLLKQCADWTKAALDSYKLSW